MEVASSDARMHPQRSIIAEVGFQVAAGSFRHEGILCQHDGFQAALLILGAID